MNTKFVSGIFIFFLSVNCLHGQTIKYTYDDNGNRKSRVLVVEQLKSGTIQFPVTDPEAIAVEYQKEKHPEGELRASVYPNPNKGLLKIDISNMPLNSATEARLYDLSGTELMVKRNLESYYEMDISRLKDGIYILRIKINERLFDWKVVKSH